MTYDEACKLRWQLWMESQKVFDHYTINLSSLGDGVEGSSPAPVEPVA